MRALFVAALPLALTMGACGSGANSPDASPPDAAPLPPVTDPLPYADPFIGSGGFGYAAGSAFAGAVAPNGLAKVGPDTKGMFGTISFLHYAGYWYGDDTILGFSHLHLHGTGASDYGVLSVMPVPALDPAKLRVEDVGSSFTKTTESASPGYYAVTLDQGGIRVELTATPHAAHHRYTFASATGAVQFDLAHHLDGGSIPAADVTLDPATHTFTGHLHSNGGMSGGFGGYDVYFAARTKDPWTAQSVWSDGAPPANGTTASGTGVGFGLTFATTQPIEIQIGLSLVSAAGAAANLAAEMPSFDFDGEKTATAAAWDARLQTILVEGGTLAQRRILYSSLYKAFLMPSWTADVDGTFLYAGPAPRSAPDYHFVSDMSLWDTYRTLNPLYDLIAPDRARDVARSLVAMANASGFFPKWPIATGEAGTMIGASAEIVLADAYVKGVTDFDAEGAYQILRAAAMDPSTPPGGRGGRDAVVPYLTLGYVPSDASDSSVSLTTEYAADDNALGTLAAALGHTADSTALATRATGYHAIYDPSVGFLRGKTASGVFPAGTQPYDPLDFSHDYREANGWQSVWEALHDADGLATLMGGRDAFITKLTTFFTMAQADLMMHPFDDIAASSSPRPYFWQGNEPDIHAAYLFAQEGRPDLTADWVRWIMATLYNDQANGIPGNDDGGTMSAWWVFSALGIYPVAGTDRYFIGTPLFSKATITVPGGTFTIVADGVSDSARYVQSVDLDGMPITVPMLHHADLAAGKTLHFVMGTSPSSWGK
jgi:predicted alpha-1,2-mannosidase